MAVPAKKTRGRRSTSSPGAAAPEKKLLGLKPWQLGLAAVTFAVVLYVIWKRSQGQPSTASTAATTGTDTTGSDTLSTTGATSGQPPENSVPPPTVIYNIYPPDTPSVTTTTGSSSPGPIPVTDTSTPLLSGGTAANPTPGALPSASDYVTPPPTAGKPVAPAPPTAF